MAPARSKQATLPAAIEDCRAAVVDFTEAAGKAILYHDECLKLAKLTKRLASLLDELQDARPDPTAEQEGIQALKAVTAALQRCNAFCRQCSTLGPIQTIFSSLHLAQQLTNCSIDLHIALSAVDAAALRASPELQEDLAQFVRQLARLNTCSYSEQQHRTLFELYVQGEHVRSGQADASVLSAILTQQVLVNCTVAQLVSDIGFLQQALQAEHQAGNHVGKALYQQLLGVCQALLPKDIPADSLLPVTQQQTAEEPAPPTTAAADLIAILVNGASASGVAVPSASINSSHSNSAASAARVQAGLSLLASLSPGPAENAVQSELQLAAGEAASAAPELPNAVTDDTLQALADPRNLKLLLHLFTANSTDTLLRQLIAQILQTAAATAPAMTTAFISTVSALAGLARLVTSNSTEEKVQVAVLQLLAVLCKDTAAAEQLVQQQKIVPALVQIVGEVKVVKGKAAGSLVAPIVLQQPTTVEVVQATAGSAGELNSGLGGPRGASTAGFASPVRNRVSTRASEGVMVPSASAAQGTTAGAAGPRRSIASGGRAGAVAAAAAAQAAAAQADAAVVIAALKVLQVLASTYWAQMLSAGVMPALATLLAGPAGPAAVGAATPAAGASIHTEGLQLLGLLLQQDNAAAFEAVQHQLLPVLVYLHQQSRSQELQESIQQALLLLLRPPAASASEAAPSPASIAAAAVPADSSSSSRGSRMPGRATVQPASNNAGSRGAAGNSTTDQDAQLEVQAEVGRRCSAVSVSAGMQLLTIGVSELTQPLLTVLTAAASNSQESRTAAYQHDTGITVAIQLATSQPTAAFGPGTTTPAASAGAEVSADVAAAAVGLLVQITEEKQLKADMAHRVAEVLLAGTQHQVLSAAWLVYHLATAHRPEVDKAVARASAEFCDQLVAANALPSVLGLLLSSELQYKAAGVAAVSCLARFGGPAVQSALLSSGAVPPLVDVIRNTAAMTEPIAAAATAALAGLATADDVPGAAAAVCDLLVACLQPSSLTVAANAAAALLKIAGSDTVASQLVSAGAVAAVLKVLQEPSDKALTAAQPSATLLAYLLRTISSSGSSRSSSPSKKKTPVPPAAQSGAVPNDAVPVGAAMVLLNALRAMRDDGVRLPIAAALGQVLKRPTAAADREAVVAAQAVQELLDVLRSTAASTAAPAWVWEDAATGLASLGAANSTACNDLARGLRQMVLRGSAKDAGAAVAVAAKLAVSPRGRAALLSEGLAAGLVGVVGNQACSAAARAAAAAAIGALAVPNTVVLGADDVADADESSSSAGSKPSNPSRRAELASNTGRGSPAVGSGSPMRGLPAAQQQALKPGARVVDPKVECVRSGAAAALVALVRANAGDRCLVEASEALYVLAGCKAGVDAAVAAGVREALQVVVLAGKRREVGEKAAKAAYEALMRFL